MGAGENGVTVTSLVADVAEDHAVDEGCGSDRSHTSGMVVSS